LLASAQTLAQNLTTLAIFNKPDGTYPSAGLIADANGNLFGTTAGGGAYYGGTVFEITGSAFLVSVPFSSLSAELVVTGGQRPAFALNANFGLGAASTGINPPVQPVTLRVGTYTATIPAGSFKQLASGRGATVWAFNGTIGGASLALDILSLGNNSYQFGAGATPVNVTANPVPVSLSIGNNSGSTSVNATRVPRLAATGP
jgi:hypothetical protein